MPLETGDGAPFFRAAALNGNPAYSFDSAAGRPILMLFLGSGGWAPSAAALTLVERNNQLFDDQHAIFFGVTVDRQDATLGRIYRRIPGIRWFLDYDTAVSRLYGAAADRDAATRYHPHWLLLDEGLRVVQWADIADGEAIFATLRAMIADGPERTHAPVLVVPRIFEPELCRELIGLYEKHGGTESGFMRQENGLTVAKMDHNFKRRSDYEIEDEDLKKALVTRLRRRLIPQIHRSFQFHATRIERWIVACYDADGGGFFRPHRDNTTTGTAHRQFACTINLNAEDYDGGELRFPEFGQRTYRAPTGGAVVFSCSLLHEASAVTRGKRYAFLPFLYDEEAAKVREANFATLADRQGEYRAHRPTGQASAG